MRPARANRNSQKTLLRSRLDLDDGSVTSVGAHILTVEGQVEELKRRLNEALALAEEVHGWAYHEPNRHRLKERIEELRSPW